MNVQIQPYLDFPYDDISLKLVEWIEISRALGADKIFLYQLDLHPNIVKVMTVKGQFKRVPYLYPPRNGPSQVPREK